MRVQDLSNSDKAWFLWQTRPGGFLRGKVEVQPSSGDLQWSDDSARAWFEAELAKRHGQPPTIQQPPVNPPPVNPGEADLRAALERLEAVRNLISVDEYNDARRRIIEGHF